MSAPSAFAASETGLALLYASGYADPVGGGLGGEETAAVIADTAIITPARMITKRDVFMGPLAFAVV